MDNQVGRQLTHFLLRTLFIFGLPYIFLPDDEKALA